MSLKLDLLADKKKNDCIRRGAFFLRPFPVLICNRGLGICKISAFTPINYKCWLTYGSRWPNKKLTPARNRFLVPNTIWALPWRGPGFSLQSFCRRGQKRISATILNASKNKIYGVNLVILPNRTLLNPGQSFSLSSSFAFQLQCPPLFPEYYL